MNKLIVSFVAVIMILITGTASANGLQQSCWIKDKKYDCPKGNAAVIVTAEGGKRALLCRPAHLPLLENEKACTGKAPTSAPRSLPANAVMLDDEPPTASVSAPR
jgi:hypothetical protein